MTRRNTRHWERFSQYIFLRRNLVLKLFNRVTRSEPRGFTQEPVDLVLPILGIDLLDKGGFVNAWTYQV